MQQHGVAIVIGLIEIDLRLLRRGVAQHALVILLHRLDRQRGLRQIGLGVVERDLELPRIEPIENLAGFDLLVVLHVDVLDDARDVGRDADLVGFDIGVVGRHHLAAGDVPVRADGEQHSGKSANKPQRMRSRRPQSTNFVASRSRTPWRACPPAQSA